MQTTVTYRFRNTSEVKTRTLTGANQSAQFLAFCKEIGQKCDICTAQSSIIPVRRPAHRKTVKG